MDTPYFTLERQRGFWTLTFSRRAYADTFARMEFHSRLLHSLKPNGDRVWQNANRLNAEIVGWPKNLKWERTGELSFRVRSSDDTISYAGLLNTALVGIIDGEEVQNGRRIFTFSIRHEETITEYRFHGKARTIAALCVLLDLERHPRNDLEINIPKKLAIKEWPVIESEEIQRTYGDPSKTADELRNEGWSRMGDNAGMEVSRDWVGGQMQQMYRLLRQDQDIASQMQRSNISRRWKEALYRSQNHTCQICLTQYDSTLLEPDHRVPVIYEADQLTEENYLTKLMTLCRFCNQQKRETTKRLPSDYDWSTSPWAYPERFELEVVKRKLLAHKERTGKTIPVILAEVKTMLEPARKITRVARKYRNPRPVRLHQ